MNKRKSWKTDHLGYQRNDASSAFLLSNQKASAETNLKEAKKKQIKIVETIHVGSIDWSKNSDLIWKCDGILVFFFLSSDSDQTEEKMKYRHVDQNMWME